MTMQTLRSVDVETTGEMLPEHKVVELGCVDLEMENGNRLINGRSEFVNPHRLIPPDARGIHHISDADVAQAKDLDVVVKHMLTNFPEPVAYFAHNRAFEMFFLGEFTGVVPWICTWKVALRLWPDAPNHKNQTLRYFLGLEIPDHYNVGPPHRALPDAIVTGFIMQEMLKLTTVEQMIEWSNEPTLLPRCPIGEFRGKPWSAVDKGFLDWCLKQEGMEEDLKWNVRRELDARNALAMRRAGYVANAREAIPVAGSVPDLEAWFRGEARSREELGIVPGTNEFAIIVGACADHKRTLETTRTPALALSSPQQTGAAT